MQRYNQKWRFVPLFHKFSTIFHGIAATRYGTARYRGREKWGIGGMVLARITRITRIFLSSHHYGVYGGLFFASRGKYFFYATQVIL